MKAGFGPSFLWVQLADGREVRVPLEFFPVLKAAKAGKRRNFRLIGGGTGIHWPELDEDLSVDGLLAGRRAR